jgi:hypothetical protein
MVGLVAAVAALSLLPHPVVADEKDELHRTGKRLGEVEAVLRDARADAGAVAAALAAADRAVARSRARLATAKAELDRGAYMTGRVTGLAMLVEAGDLRDLVERAVTLSYVISADQDTLRRLEVARKRAVQLHHGMVRAERARVAAEARVRDELAEVERVRTLRKQAKDKLDARVARLAGAAAALRRRSAEHWIIMKESSGDPTADNPTSTAFGLGQLLLGNRLLDLGQDYATTECGRQLWAFRAYVRDRYGTAARAKAFWQANGWY